jgi:hypothetical protein
VINLSWNSDELKATSPGRIMPAITRAAMKAGSTALRDMRAEAAKRVRRRKRIKAGIVREALVMRRPRREELDGADWTLAVKGKRVPLTAYPHRQGKRGVSVEVNRGKRTMIASAFVATMKSGHKGVFVRSTKARLPIRELFGSRPVDALRHKGEAEGVQARGRASFAATFARMLPLELEKVKAKGSA